MQIIEPCRPYRGATSRRPVHPARQANPGGSRHKRGFDLPAADSRLRNLGGSRQLPAVLNLSFAPYPSMSCDRLIAYLKESDHLLAASRLLQWDQETGMPSGGQAVRADALSTLAGLSHQRATSPHLRELLEFAAAQADSPDRIRQLELVRRDLDRASKIPANLVERMAKATSLAQQVWSKARAQRDFALFQPHLQEVVALKREEGALLAPAGGTSYDGLLSDYEPLMRTQD